MPSLLRVDPIIMIALAALALPAAYSPTPSEFVKSMGMGINLGNTLDAPHEGAWAAPAQEYYFDGYKAAGFKSVRVPCQYSQHISDTKPYFTEDNPFLKRVFEVASWSIQRNLTTVVNTHHDDWLDGSTSEAAFAHNLERLVAIWEAIGEKFAAVPDALLAFEVYNEPHLKMTTDWLNRMNAAVLPAIRATNPTRTVFLGGLKFMNPNWIVKNPNAITMLPPGGPTDPHLALEVHSYDPYNFCGGSKTGPTTHTYAPGEVRTWADPLRSWATARNVAILLGEFGCTKQQTNQTGRLAWYREVGDVVRSHGFAATAWDDSGHFELYHRAQGTWDEDVLHALGVKPMATTTVEEMEAATEENDKGTADGDEVGHVPDPSWRPME